MAEEQRSPVHYSRTIRASPTEACSGAARGLHTYLPNKEGLGRKEPAVGRRADPREASGEAFRATIIISGKSFEIAAKAYVP